MAINQCRQWHAHYFRESLRLSQPGNRNFLQIGSRQKPTEPNADLDRHALANRSSDNYVTVEWCDRFRDSVHCGAILRAGKLAQLLRRRELGRIVAAVHPQLDFEQRRERFAHHLGQWIQHQ